MCDLFEMPLAEARYVPGPDGCGKARYVLVGPTKREPGMLGPICGKILLAEKVNGEREPRVFDPSYIVIQADEVDNRYYIDIIESVAKDSANAYKTNTAPKYIPQPMEAVKRPDRKK